MVPSFEDIYLRHIFTINKFGLSTRGCYVLGGVNVPMNADTGSEEGSLSS
jgi:hypothetical protein